MHVRHLALILTVSATVAAVSGLGACSSSGSGTGLPSQSPVATGSPSPAPASAFGLATNKQYGVLGQVSPRLGQRRQEGPARRHERRSTPERELG